jgi:hypothetical protein
MKNKKVLDLESMGFWILLTTKHDVSELDVLPSSGDGKETTTLLGPLERANLRAIAALPSPEVWNSSSFRNFVFSSYLEFSSPIGVVAGVKRQRLALSIGSI